MSSLKEIKVPIYKKGEKYDEYIIRLMHVAGTRGRMRQVLSGDFMTKMPGYTTDDDGNRVREEPDEDQVEMAKENQRALAELIQAMPSGRIIRIINKAVSDAFPEGCT